MKDQGLWRRLREFRFDVGTPALTFEHRLARENGWSPQFADRCVEEYRRFLYLAMTAGHIVTPSDHVDQVWHLHLTYSRSYWERLCGEVLRRPLHHEPTRGGGHEDAKYLDLYERTVDSYLLEFGEDPPRDLWPDPRERFDHDAHARRVNTLDHWVVPRRTLKRAFIGAGMISGAACFALVAVGCRNKPGIGGYPLDWFALAAVGFAVLALIVKGVRSGATRRGGTQDGGGGCGGWFGSGCGGDGADGGSGCGGDGGGSGCGGGCGGD